MTTTHRVAFIGCGGRAREHAKAVVKDSRLQVVALSDVKPENAQSLGDTFGFNAEIFADYTAMLASAKPDIVIACVWTPLHLPIFQACAGAGVKAVLSEKPMAPTWGDCLEMARIAQETRCQLTFCHQRRFASGNKAIRQWIAQGLLGTVQRLDLYSPANLLDCGTHTIDQALSFNNDVPGKWILGAVDGQNPIKYFNVSSESLAVGTLVFQNNVRATLQVGGPDMDLWGGVRVIGSKGFVVADWGGKIQQAVIYDNPNWIPVVTPGPEGEEMDGVIRNAVDCLVTGAEPELSYQKALRTSEIIYGLYESVRRRTRIEIPLQGFTDNPFVTMLDRGDFGPRSQ